MTGFIPCPRIDWSNIRDTSMPNYSLVLLGSIVLGAILLLIKTYIQKRRNPAGLPYPPGPPGYPFIGNVLDIPKEATWETYGKWAKQYGVYFTNG